MEASDFLMQLYQQYHVAKNDERLGLFELLADRYGIMSALYPGCFVHITPSFFYPTTTYVEMDKRGKKFFNDPNLLTFITKHKRYSEEPKVTFYATDYYKTFPAPEGSFDLLISQYAGFVSQPCKKYLKIGGLLLVNNSHGDASMAWLDEDYDLVGVVNHRSGQYRLVENNLDEYFIPKSTKIEITKSYLEKIGRGIGYKKSGSAYIFKRVG